MRRERGLALIVALLIVALTALIASDLMRGESVWFKESTNVRALAQGQAAIDGALRLAAVELSREGQNVDIDALTGQWAQPLPRFPVAGGVVTADLTDPQGRFNLNDLVVDGHAAPGAVATFSRLLQLLGLNPALAQAVVAYETPPGMPDGGFDASYPARAHPYRAARQPFAGVSELRLVQGFSAHIVQALRPYVSALPLATAVNVDTAPGVVLAALVPGLTVKEGLTLSTEAMTQPFQTTAAFAAALPRGMAPAYAIAVQTQYFMAHVTARFDGLTVRRRALLYRPNRAQTTLILWQEALWRHHHASTTTS